MISVLILTFNEEVNLTGCLDSVVWSNDIVIFDSYSTDSTVEIAREFGARVYQRKFDDYAGQRNAALNEVTFKNSWVLMVDADERWPREIYTESIAAIKSDKDDRISIYHFRRKDYFSGRWLKRSNGYPSWAGRLVRLGKVSVKRKINEEYHTIGGKAFLNSHFFHYPFNKGLSYWIERHNRYSSMEARTLIDESRHRMRGSMLLSHDPTIRRKFYKRLAYRLPCRPLLVFCYLFFIRLGFLDGMAGLTYCRLRCIYEYTIDLKIKELRSQKKDQAEPGLEPCVIKKDASSANQSILSS